MSDDCGGELSALKAVIEACRAQANALDMPALAYLLDRAVATLDVHAAEPCPPRDASAGAPTALH